MPTPESSRIFFRGALEHFVVQEIDEFFHFRRAGAPFDSGVHVFGVLAEDHDVHALGIAHGRGHAGEITHRAHAGVEIEHLAQGDVQRANAAADRSGERTFDGDAEIANRVDGVLRQPFLELVISFFAGENFQPFDFAFAAVGFFDGGIEHAPRSLPDVAAGAVAFDERNHRMIRHAKHAVRKLDGLAI